MGPFRNVSSYQIYIIEEALIYWNHIFSTRFSKLEGSFLSQPGNSQLCDAVDRKQEVSCYRVTKSRSRKAPPQTVRSMVAGGDIIERIIN